MRTSLYGGNQVINGTFGTIWIDGYEVFEIESFEARITFERDEVHMAGNLDEDSKVIGQSGEGSYTVKKVYSNGLRKLVEMTKNGKDARFQLIGKLADPDALSGQTERVSIDNVWMNEFDLMNFEMAEKVEQEYDFGFTPSSVRVIDSIN